ncbi:MAG TPA: hypothetical protein VFU71_17925, partial [Burkholderiaceae bacterium]|nr:hypothetical protein [Burkholderiaceae bacterium]
MQFDRHDGSLCSKGAVAGLGIVSEARRRVAARPMQAFVVAAMPAAGIQRPLHIALRHVRDPGVLDAAVLRVVLSRPPHADRGDTSMRTVLAIAALATIGAFGTTDAE